MKKNLSSTYVVYDVDELALPVALFDDVSSCARFLGVRETYLLVCLRFGAHCGGYEVRVYYGLD